jgi:uncharacterized protein YndB with AHSA1/START domain
MKYPFVATVEIFIRATPERVWQGLTDPALVKQYFFGTEVISDWKTGSPLIYKGTWEGKEYLEKGTILESEPPKRLRTDYFSSFSELPNIPENYLIITYDLIPEKDGTLLRVTQENIDTQERKQHSEENWKNVLTGLKELLEKG